MGGKVGEIEEIHFQGLRRVDGMKMPRAPTIKAMTIFSLVIDTQEKVVHGKIFITICQESLIPYTNGTKTLVALIFWLRDDIPFYEVRLGFWVSFPEELFLNCFKFLCYSFWYLENGQEIGRKFGQCCFNKGGLATKRQVFCFSSGQFLLASFNIQKLEVPCSRVTLQRNAKVLNRKRVKRTT